MKVAMTIAELAVIFLLPAVILRLIRRFPRLNALGAITICYFFGFVFSLLPIPYDKGLAQTVASLLVAISMPLVLFGFDVTSIRRLAKSTVVSFLLFIAIVAVTTAAGAFLIAESGYPYAPELAGMTTGVYIGGTPNLYAVGSAMLKDFTYINSATIAESVVGGIYFLLILTVVKRVYHTVLDKNRRGEPVTSDAGDPAQDDPDRDTLPRDKAGVWRLIGVCLLAGACFGTGALIEWLINGNLDGSLYIIITASLLGIAFSFVKPIRRVRGTYRVGQYLILVFSLGLSMSLNLSSLTATLIPTLLYYIGVTAGAVILHFLLCMLLHIDGGTALITSVAGIYGPPFIAPVAEAYGKKEYILPGVICGVFGLVVGNFCGIGLCALLRLFL